MMKITSYKNYQQVYVWVGIIYFKFKSDDISSEFLKKKKTILSDYIFHIIINMKRLNFKFKSDDISSEFLK